MRRDLGFILITLGMLLGPGCAHSRFAASRSSAEPPAAPAATPPAVAVDREVVPAAAEMVPDVVVTDGVLATFDAPPQPVAPAPPSQPTVDLPDSPPREIEMLPDGTSETANVARQNLETYPIDLPTALALADAQSLEVAFARARVAEALARELGSRALWLPTIQSGANYNKHEGVIQDVVGLPIQTSRGALWGGLGAGAVGAASPAYPGLVANFQLSDAWFAPLAARRARNAREYATATASVDAIQDVALAFLELIQARDELVAAQATLAEAKNLASLTAKFAETGEGLASDADRARTEAALRENDAARAYENIQVASARLAQLLRLEPGMLLEPQEPTVAPLELIPAGLSRNELIAEALAHRPELGEARNLVAEASARLRGEQTAPWLPSIVLGASYGGFGAGLGGNIGGYNDRFDFDAVAYWRLRNLGFGEAAARDEARARMQQARVRQMALLDQVAREVVEQHARVEARRPTIETARQALEAADASYAHNMTRIREGAGLPIEALQAIQALGQARREYIRVVTEFNAAQFSLHRAIGWFGTPDQSSSASGG